jgi:hypothetical protein
MSRKTKSSELKKYESIYQKCLKEQQKSTKCLLSKKASKKSPKKESKKESKKSPKKESKKSPKKESKKSPKKESKKSPKKESKKDVKKTLVSSKLNTYQLFVKNESKKNKYKGLEAKERMLIIGKEWQKMKK